MPTRVAYCIYRKRKHSKTTFRTYVFLSRKLSKVPLNTCQIRTHRFVHVSSLFSALHFILRLQWYHDFSVDRTLHRQSEFRTCDVHYCNDCEWNRRRNRANLVLSTAYFCHLDEWTALTSFAVPGIISPGVVGLKLNLVIAQSKQTEFVAFGRPSTSKSVEVPRDINSVNAFHVEVN